MVVDEVLGGGEVPAERLAERFRVAVVPLVEQEEQELQKLFLKEQDQA